MLFELAVLQIALLISEKLREWWSERSTEKSEQTHLSKYEGASLARFSFLFVK